MTNRDIYQFSNYAFQLSRLNNDAIPFGKHVRFHIINTICCIYETLKIFHLIIRNYHQHVFIRHITQIRNLYAMKIMKVECYTFLRSDENCIWYQNNIYLFFSVMPISQFCSNWHIRFYPQICQF